MTTGRSLDRSRALWEYARTVIPGGTNTISKRVTAFGGTDGYPAYIGSAHGCRVTDVDGNEYIDFVAGLAPIILGYCNERVDSRIARQLQDGILFSLPTHLEIELSDRLVDLVPCAEMVRLFKTGAEATSAAIRAARAVTGRDLVVSCGYSGWHDWWAVQNDVPGIPACAVSHTLTLEFDDTQGAIDTFESRGKAIGALIVTPAIYGSHPTPGFLETLRELADTNGTVLIFDEIITGFRWALGGAQEKYEVTPDLAAFAKGMANGMPIAALAGKRDVMSALSENWVTSTYASEALSIAAALETLSIIEEESVVPRLYAIAEMLRKGLRELASQHHLQIDVGDDVPVVRFSFAGAEGDCGIDQFAFIAECARRSVLIRADGVGYSLCPMMAHENEDVALALQAFDGAIRAVAGA